MSEYRGASIELVRRRIRENDGMEPGLLAKLAPEEADLYQTASTDMWADVFISDRVLDAAAGLLYPDDPHPRRTLGRDLAHDNLRGVFRMLLKVTTVRFAIMKSAQTWGTYHRGGRARVLKEPGKNLAMMLVEDYPDLPRGIRESVTGFVSGILDLTGARYVKVEERDQDPNMWIWRITWQ